MKSMKRSMLATFARTILYGLLILIELILVIFLLWYSSKNIFAVYVFLRVLSVILVLTVIAQDENTSYKLAWTVPILIFPIFGGVFYLIFGIDYNWKKHKQVDIGFHDTGQNSPRAQLQQMDMSLFRQSEFLRRSAMFPLYGNTASKYIKSGSEKFEEMIKYMKEAKKFIFLEYFIIDTGVMWDTVFSVLKEKCAEGLDIRIIYDDFGCKNLLPNDYPEVIKRCGIKCRVFNRLKPKLLSYMNNRDHRKILIIDGNIGFTGGINIADEYIDVKKPHGKWRDSAIMIRGQAVLSMTAMFLSMWNEERSVELEPYAPSETDIAASGFVQPYSDVPSRKNSFCKAVYMNMINRAEEYLYITTPYLIIDDELTNSLCLLSKSGCDVRIVLPNIPDNKFINAATEGNFPVLLDAGVRLYKYVPGFIHSKTFVSDDKFAIVGSVNLDYRSLFLHFESGVALYLSDTVIDIRDDFLSILGYCTEVHKGQLSLIKRIINRIARLFSPII